MGQLTFPTVAQTVEFHKGRLELETFLSGRLAGLNLDKHLQWLLALPWRAIYTTNYDSAIERVFQLAESPAHDPISISAIGDLVDLLLSPAG